MWTEKYRPRRLDEVVGNKTAVEALKNFNWKKPLLLHGAAGTGKTSIINAVAIEKGFEPVEVNEENIGSADAVGETSSIYGGRRLIVIEDVDQLSETKKVAEFLEKTRNPTILTATDSKSKKLKALKGLCIEVQLRRPQPATIANYLGEICGHEKVKADKEVLLSIAKNCGGNMMTALIDLETLSKGRHSITVKELGEIYGRDVEGDIYKTLGEIFNGKDIKEVVASTWNVDDELRNIIFWVDENTPHIIQEAKPLSRAFHFLSRADVFLGRIMRRQYWGFLRYANALMTAGVNTSKEKTRYAMYRFPGYFAALGRTKAERNMAKGISDKLCARIHSSKATIIKEDIPLLKTLVKKGRVDEGTLAAEYQLSSQEIEYLKDA